MNPVAATPHECRYDVFISYSRKDREFAGRIEKELRGYKPPKDLAVPQRFLRVFRDEEDFTGGEYYNSLDRSLRDAAKLIVICSPRSAASEYVADEIRRFAAERGKEHIVPILLDGIPNNEATESDRGQSAFPEELIRLLPMPLAADYRGFNAKDDKLRKGTFARAWFKTLADVYADYGVDRSAIEQRERRRAEQRLRNIAAVSSAVALALIGLTIWALLSRNEATRQRDNSEARRYEAEARLAFGGSGEALSKATLLSVVSLRFARTVDGHLALARFLNLLPRAPLWRQSLTQHTDGLAGGRYQALAFSPDGSRIASLGGAGPLQLLDARTGQVVSSIELVRQPTQRTVAVFSPDGRFLVVGCAQVACVVDVASGQMVTRLPPDRNQGSMVWSASFSPDGGRLALSAYGSDAVFIYEVPTWRLAGTLEPKTGNVFSVAFSPDGHWLATATPQGLQLWREGQYAKPVNQISPTEIIWSIAFQPDSTGFIAAGRALQAWQIVSGEAGGVQLERGATAAIEAHTVLPVSWHGRTCFAAATPDAVHLLCGESLEEVVRLPVSSAAAAAMTGADRRSIVNGQIDGTVAVWSLDAGLEALRITIGAPIRSIATTDRGGWLAAAADNGAIAVLALDTWKERTRLHLPAAVKIVNASADGRWLVAAESASVHVYDTTTWREASSSRYADAVIWAGFDPGGHALIVVAGKAVAVIEPGSWRERLRVEHDEPIQTLRVSGDGGRFATVTHFSSGGHDGGVFLTRTFDLSKGTESGWEYKTGGAAGNISQDFMEKEAAQKRRTLVGGDAAEVHASESSWPALDLSEPNERVSADKVWSIHVGGSVAELTDAAASRSVAAFDHGGDITAVRFVPGLAPRWLVSAGEDGTLAMWPIRSAELADQACTRLTTTLGAEGVSQLIAAGHLERSCDAVPTATMAGR